MGKLATALWCCTRIHSYEYEFIICYKLNINIAMKRDTGMWYLYPCLHLCFRDCPSKRDYKQWHFISNEHFYQWYPGFQTFPTNGFLKIWMLLRQGQRKVQDESGNHVQERKEKFQNDGGQARHRTEPVNNGSGRLYPIE